MKVLMVASDDPTFRFYTGTLIRSYPSPGVVFALYFPLEYGLRANVSKLAQAIAEQKPDIVHFQHEYGCFGSKRPFRYSFPLLVKELRKLLPNAKLVATAHTVLPSNFRYPLSGRGLQIPARLLANLFLMPFLRKIWGRKTWGALDGVVVHSELQREAIERSKAPKVWVIPHFVPQLNVGGLPQTYRPFRIMVFGYFTPEKGQDLLIEATRKIRDLEYEIVFAGGLRREEDRHYFDLCMKQIEKLGRSARIQVTGFLNDSQIDEQAQHANLAVAPFRESHGSGSLAQLFGRGVPILASDLPINVDLDCRVPGVLSFFKKNNVKDLAKKIEGLSVRPDMLERQRELTLQYREQFSPQNVMIQHQEVYQS